MPAAVAWDTAHSAAVASMTQRDQSCNANRTWTVTVMRSCGIAAGNGGSIASRSIASAAASRIAEPDPREMATPRTRPERSTVNVTTTLPVSPRRRASAG